MKRRKIKPAKSRVAVKSQSAPAPALTPSRFQQDILDAVQNGRDNIMIQACAGSGKTATLRMICDVLPPGTRTLALCFNRAVAKDFGERLPPNVEAGTFHSVGLKIIRKAVGQVDVQPKKSDRVIFDQLDETGVSEQDQKKRWAVLKRLVPLTLATMTNPNDIDALENLAADYGIVVNNPHLYYNVAIIIDRGRSAPTEVSFDDMIDHPLHFGYATPRYDVILIDETQDLNCQQMEFVDRLAVGARVIAVGDSYQSIYGFRGAYQGAMDMVGEQFDCINLPLSVCYRCGKQIVSAAQEVVGRKIIQPAPDAPPGRVDRLEPDDYAETVRSLTPGDMVVCRTNAPLVQPCLDLIKAGVSACVKGRDIGVGLVAFLDKHAASFIDCDVGPFSKHLSGVIFIRQNQLLQSNRRQAAELLQDQLDILLVFLDAASTISRVRETIGRIFADDTKGVMFSSIHRAKGGQADKVVFLGPELIPHRMAVQLGTPEALRQERNLNYVARTRARSRLIFQPLPDGKEKNHA